jgi:hypothetical protein
VGADGGHRLLIRAYVNRVNRRVRKIDGGGHHHGRQATGGASHSCGPAYTSPAAPVSSSPSARRSM